MQFYKEWRNTETEEEKTHYKTMFKKQQGTHYHMCLGKNKN